MKRSLEVKQVWNGGPDLVFLFLFNENRASRILSSLSRISLANLASRLVVKTRIPLTFPQPRAGIWPNRGSRKTPFLVKVQVATHFLGIIAMWTRPGCIKLVTLKIPTLFTSVVVVVVVVVVAALALIMEGVLSACYHVCPNNSNFQFGK